MLLGVLPSISRASSPTASVLFVRTSFATTDGSRSTMALPLTYTRTLAVPRSIPMSMVVTPRNSLRATCDGTAFETTPCVRARRTKSSDRFRDRLLDRGDASVVTAVEGPLLDPFRADEPGVRKDLHVLAHRRL